MAKLRLENGVYMFDAEDGSEVVACKEWVEKSKANDTHPEGKPWIVLPKGNITNRTYISKDLFEATNVNGEITIDVKTTAPRVLGSTGVKQQIVKYLDEATAEEYTNLVNKAVDAYKAAKGTSKKKKPEEMTREELEAYIEALKSGVSFKATTGPKSFMEMFTDEEYARYNEILALAQENKANMPKAKRGPLTDEEKAIRSAKRKANELSKAEKILAALQANFNISLDDVVDDFEDIDED